MKKEELMINNKKIVLMEQPSQYILELEKRFSDNDLVGYCEEILKYPADTNPKLEELLNIPDIVKYGDLELSLKKENGEKDLYLAQEILTSVGQNKHNPAYVAEFFLKRLKKDVNDYKYHELVKMGEEVFKQVGELLYLVQIRETFRRM